MGEEEAKKNLSKTGPGRISGLPANEKTFQLSMFFPPPRFFALQQIKRNPHPWGTLLDYSLFSSRFHGSPFAFPPIASGRAGAGYAWQIAFLVPCTRYVVSFPRKKWGEGGRGGRKKEEKGKFFSANTRKISRHDASAVTDVRLAGRRLFLFFLFPFFFSFFSFFQSLRAGNIPSQRANLYSLLYANAVS